MDSLSILRLLVLFCLIPSYLILLWSSSQTASTGWEATVSAAVYLQKQPAGFFTGSSPPGNNHCPSLPHGHGEEANHHLPPWLFSAAAGACPAAGAGEAPASGCITCQGDGSDRATYWLLIWLRTCALATFLGRFAKLAWTVFLLMVRRQLEAKRRARPGPPPAPVLGDDDEEGAPANAEPGAPVPPPPQGAENVPNAAGEAAGTRPVVEPSAIVAAAVSGPALLFSLRPPPPLPARSISAPERLSSRSNAVTAENAISGDVSPASAASRVRANTIGFL